MKAGNPHLLDVIRYLGPDSVGYVLHISLRLSNGTRLTASKVVHDSFLIHGNLLTGNGAFMVPAEELVAVEVEWDGAKPEGVKDIPSAVAYERKRAKTSEALSWGQGRDQQRASAVRGNALDVRK